MAGCSACGKTILFGGIKDGGALYCGKPCQTLALQRRAESLVPEAVVEQHVQAIFNGTCPVCKKTGPVDIHYSHTVWSALYLTSWRSTPHMCCRPCAKKKQTSAIISSALLGWWGLPWGLIRTPGQIAKNIEGMRRVSTLPSADLRQHVLMHLARQAVVAQAPQPK